MKRALEQYKEFDKALDLARDMVSFVLTGDGDSLLTNNDDPAQEAARVTLESVASASGQLSNKRWTPELDDRLRDMWGQKILVRGIAAQLGRSEASINSRVRLLQLPKRRTQKGGKATGFNKFESAEPT